MIKKTFAVVSIAALTGVGAMSVLPDAQAAMPDRSGIIELAACSPCNPCAAKKKKNACNPCAAKSACSPCNPCAAKNPCNPCAAKKQ